jgi:hypothetical protein
MKQPRNKGASTSKSKTGRPRVASKLPECPTVLAAVAMTGVPGWVWKDARRRGSPGFDRVGRINPDIVLAWWFGEGQKQEENTDWKGRREKANALRAELELEKDRGELIPAAEVQRGIASGMSRCFAAWDRACSLLPPRGKGLDEKGLKALMIEAGEQVKQELRKAFGTENT